MKRSMGVDAAHLMEEKIRQSLLYSRKNPEKAWPYIRQHAQEMAPDVIERHIDMFVNDFSFNVGAEGERAVRFILEAAAAREGTSLPDKPLFCG